MNLMYKVGIPLIQLGKGYIYQTKIQVKSMRKLSFLLLLFVWCSGATAQDYTEKYRPQVHFTPAKNWMNDPNGLVFHNGKYHLFYQHNPFGNTWGHMSWGHAVSNDLVHWEHLPVALGEENNVMIFSGSAVVDKYNSSGLGSTDIPPLMAIYTGHHPESEIQDQRIAYSLDNGRRWTKYQANPVIGGMAHFRDPKVIWHEETNQWVMVVALSEEHKIRFYGSENLKQWELLGDFGRAGAEGVRFWECPDLFELPVDGDPGTSKWVLQVDVNPGSAAGGSGGQYFTGEFDGKRFVPDSATVDKTFWVDYGRDFYAVQSYSNIPEHDGRRIWIAWMNNWDYAERIPTSPWRSAMTVPREVRLVSTDNGIRLTQQPVRELKKLRGEYTRVEDVKVSPGRAFMPGFRGKAYEIMIELDPGDAQTFGLKVRKGDNEETIIGYDTNQQQLFVDRTRSGAVNFDSTFADITRAPLKLDDALEMHIIVDWSSVEVFAGNGTISMTNRIFPSPGSRDIEIFSDGGSTTVKKMDIWRLKSAWANSNANE